MANTCSDRPKKLWEAFVNFFNRDNRKASHPLLKGQYLQHIRHVFIESIAKVRIQHMRTPRTHSEGVCSPD